MDRENENQKRNRQYRNVVLCTNCKQQFLFSEALARQISFGLTDKVCPYCGGSNITFIKFADNHIQSYLNRFKTTVNN